VSYFSRFPAFELIQAPWRSGTVKRRIANLARLIVPPTLAPYAMSVALHDRWYLRSAYSGTAALRKVAADERPWTWFSLF
jgi:hypothetical protein